jgi:hypothetical protein
MDSRSKLRMVEEDLSHRNGRISMLQSALRQRSTDHENKIQHLKKTIRSLRKTSDVHDDLAKLASDLSSAQTRTEHVLRENIELKRLASNAREISQQLQLELDSLHVVVADLQHGTSGLNVTGMTTERLVTMLASEHAKNKKVIDEMKAELGAYQRSARRNFSVGIDSLKTNEQRSRSVSPERGIGGDRNTSSSAESNYGFSSNLIPPPSVDLDGAIHRQGLSKTVVSKHDLLDVATLRARQLENRLASSEIECQQLYDEVHLLRTKYMDKEERNSRLTIDGDQLHAKQLKACNIRIASYVSENQLLREELSCSEYRVRDLTTKYLRLQKKSKRSITSNGRRWLEDENYEDDEENDGEENHTSFISSHVEPSPTQQLEVLRLERNLRILSDKETNTKKELIKVQHSLEERNQHVAVLTETIDALQSTSSRTTDQIAAELEEQAGEEEDIGQFDGSIQELLQTSTEEESLRSRVVVLTAQTIRAQTAQAQLRCHADTLQVMVEQAQTHGRRLEEKVAGLQGRLDRAKADIHVLESVVDKEREENKYLNDMLLSADRKNQNSKLELDTLKLHVETAERERNDYEKTLHVTNARHLKQSKKEYEANEKARKELMNHIITLRITVATMHARGLQGGNLSSGSSNHLSFGSKDKEEKTDVSSTNSDLLAMAEYIDVEDLVHKRSSVAAAILELSTIMTQWIHTGQNEQMIESKEVEEDDDKSNNNDKKKYKKRKGGSTIKQINIRDTETVALSVANKKIQSFHWLVENLISTITTLDRAMLDSFRDSRVLHWELLHLKKNYHVMEEKIETNLVEQWLPTEILKAERRDRAAKESLLTHFATSTTDVLRSRIVSYREHLDTANKSVVEMSRERDQWKAECQRWRQSLVQEKAQSSQGRIGAGIVAAEKILKEWNGIMNGSSEESKTFRDKLESWAQDIYQESNYDISEEEGKRTDRDEQLQKSTGKLIVRLTRELLMCKVLLEQSTVYYEASRAQHNALRLQASEADDDLCAVKMMSPEGKGIISGDNVDGIGGGGGGSSSVSGRNSERDDNQLFMLASQMETDARMEESHARQDVVQRLERSLVEIQNDRNQLQEWKEMSIKREERSRSEMVSYMFEYFFPLFL